MARFTVIDDSSRPDHTFIQPDDTCLYLYEYTAGQNYKFSETNQLIVNLKKKPSLAGTAQYGYKAPAIARCAAEIRGGFNVGWMNTATFVPVPGSKAPGDPDYDDRMQQVCRLLGPKVDVRTLVIQTQSTAPAHEAGGGHRVSVDELLAIYKIDESLTGPAPTYLAVVDDVLTTGTHFRAMKTVLASRFPGVPILGAFVARRVWAHKPDPFADFSVDDIEF